MHAPFHKPKKPDNGSQASRNRPLIQPQLEVGRPDDRFEKEADAVADRVMMQVSEEEERMRMQPVEEEEERLQMQPIEEEEEALMMQAVEEEEEALQMQPAEEEEEIVQKQASEEEEEMLQMQTQDTEEEEEAVRMQPVEEEKEKIQPKPGAAGGAATASPELSQQVASTRGTGKALDPGTQREMGRSIGADFSGVNIHTGRSAESMSRRLGARAFTVGNDIYFNRGEYNPNSPAGKRLLAHELTHTVQQGGSKIRRDNGDSAGGGTSTGTSTDNGMVLPSSSVDLSSDPPKINVGNLKLPPFKNRDHRGAIYSAPPAPLFRAANYTRGGPRQSRKWDNNVNSTRIKDKLEAAPFSMAADRTYLLTAEGQGDRYRRIGNAENIAPGLKRAFWDREGKFDEFQVDHIVELQVSGWPRNRWANELPNMELLNASANTSSGSQVRAGVESSIDSFLGDAEKAAGLPEEDRSKAKIKDKYDVTFDGISDELEEPEKVSYWKKSDIESGQHLDALQHVGDEIKLYDLQNPEPATGTPYSPHDMANEEIIGSETSFRIYKRGYGGASFGLDWSGDSNIRERASGDERIYGFHYTEIGFDKDGTNAFGEGNVGYLKGQLFKIQKDEGYVGTPEDYVWHIKRVPGTQYAGYLDHSELRNFIRRGLSLHGLSPIEFNDVYVDDENGLVAVGDVLPTVPIMSDIRLQLVLEGNDLRLQTTFTTDDFDLPSPFEIENSTLTLSLGLEEGFSISGQVDFGIENVGEGYIGAAANSTGGFELEGAFNFDSDLFDPASVEVTYRDDQFGVSGTIGIPEGKVRGIKSATITASYSENTFTASGEAELDVPGIERGTLDVRYGEEGFSVGGSFDVSSDVPGIRSGRVEATVSRTEGEDDYSVSVTGTAEPDIPGINTSLTVSYEDGAVTITGTADYSRGMLSGSVEIGATNRTINDEGQPEGEPDDTMRVYGGGSLTLQLTPWLEATAGVRFLPNGEIEVQGRIGLPDTVDVFPRREFRRTLFNAPTIEIPLFAIPLGPRSIGLVAQIRGGLDFAAGFGPGQLRELYAEVTYNPDREDETTIHGHGLFAVPADAGLTLRGSLGLGISVGIASLTGGIELTGTLGLEGEAAAEVDVNWSPQTGLALDAEGRVTVNPKFVFAVNAFARASLDLWLVSISETWRHNLTSFEWGPDIQFGIVFPIHYREGEPFDISFDDLEVIYPELDIPNLAKGLARDIKDDIF